MPACCSCVDGLRKLRGKGKSDEKKAPPPLSLPTDALKPEAGAATSASPINRLLDVLSPRKQREKLGKLLTWRGAEACNGFRVAPEVDTIKVTPSKIAPFSLPQEAITFVPMPNMMVAKFTNGDSERMIHLNIPLTAQEAQELKKLQDLARDQQLAFSPAVSVGATRFISDARGDVKLALEKMKASQAWRKEFFGQGPLEDSVLEQTIKAGVVYFAGRDFALRPVLVARLARLTPELSTEDGAKKLTRVLIYCLEYFLRYLAVPGKIENVLVLVDLHGLQLSQVPISHLLDISKVLSQQHACRVWKFYICNMPFVIRALSPIIQAAMTERQREKIFFVKDLADLLQDFAPHQLETNLGGTRPVIDKFYPFPLQKGPYKPGVQGGANEKAVTGVHQILTPEGFRGKLWDPALSNQENLLPQFSDKADGILKACGGVQFATVEAPEEAKSTDPSSPGKPQAKQGEIEMTPSTLEPVRPAGTLDSREDGSFLGDSPGKGPVFEPALEDIAVCNPRSLSCGFCRCKVGISKRYQHNLKGIEPPKDPPPLALKGAGTRSRSSDY